MNKQQALDLLDRVKYGAFVPLSRINEALLKTGDLDVFGCKRQANRTLCTDGFESGEYRTSKAESYRTGIMQLSTVVRYWAASKTTN